MSKWLSVIVVAFCALAWRIRDSIDVGRTIYNHRPGICRQVHGPGKLFLYDFNQKLGKDQLNALDLHIKGELFDQKHFHPQGLTHWVVKGVIRLYVINHSDDFKHSVEVFDYDPSGPALNHKISIKHRRFVRPNDLVAVGPDQFIYTNDGYNGASVYYWDGKEPHRLLTGIITANGIAFDAKHDKLFVVETYHKRLNVYNLNKERRNATLISHVDLKSSCDNLFIDQDGSVFVGCHPVFHEVMRAMRDCEGPTTSPSQILHVKFDEDYRKAVISEPYANDGKELSGSSVATIYNNQMLIGSVCKGLLHCEIADHSVL
ncbi:hypothetical protein PRIPAC_79342 [Pristionchus pacificus]|nr:hypothetical protein PRIPAC_79342 [Pristionchus pacificus]